MALSQPPAGGRGPDAMRRNASDRHRLLAAESRRAVLDLLRRSGEELDAAQVAAGVGRHVTTTRQHLDVLVQGGVVSRRVERRTVRGRPRILFSATSRREPDDGDGLMAMMLATHLSQGDDPAGQAEQAGRRWGRALMERTGGAVAGSPTSESDAGKDEAPDVRTATDRIVALFDEIGFDPVARSDRSGTVIDLNRCPFEHLAQAHPEIACSVHLGLMRGALETLGAPVRAHRLEPFVTPTLCRAHLRGD
jgi:predicted ArsR family transcriptional regulator